MASYFSDLFGLTGSLSTPMLILASVALIGGWVVLHWRVPVARRSTRIARFAIGTCVGTVALLLAFRSLERFLVLAASADLPWIVFGGALAIEGVAALYRLERQSAPAPIRRWTGICRVLAVASVLIMLLEPTFSKETTLIDERVVAVLVDDSLSMDLVDAQATESEKLDLADLFLPGRIDGRFSAMAVGQALDEVRRRLDIEAAWLDRLSAGSGDARRDASERLETFRAAMREASSVMQSQRDTLRQAMSTRDLSVDDAQSLEAALAGFEQNAVDVLGQVQETAASTNVDSLTESSEALSRQIDRVALAVADFNEQVGLFQAAFDRSDYTALADDLRRKVDAATAKSRREVAAATLDGVDGNQEGLVKSLQEKYVVQFYQFAGEAVAAAATQRNDAVLSVAERGTTDFATVLEKVQADVERNKLSGIVLLSDGRHNAKQSFLTAARQPETRAAGVNSVMIGSTAVATDAAIRSVVAPAQVQANDRFVLGVELKLDGLSGRSAKIELVRDGETVDEQTVTVPSRSFQTRVELGATPTEPGLMGYQVRIEPLEGEVVTENNSRDVFVRVTDDPTRLFIIEERPRWEFRYLRRLFAERDKSVRLQHLLLEPDGIAGAAERPVVHASSARPQGESEATAYPASLQEWMRFDAVILGDVAPERLGAETIAALRSFVADRGGRLIIIAGQNHMPWAYGSSPLAELIPVEFESNRSLASAREPGLLARLTGDGEQHLITRFDDDPAENRTVWEGLPELWLRYPVQGTKPNATVLAFAMPLEEPPLFRQTSDVPEEAERLGNERQAFTRENALITVLPYGAGQVLMLNFDGTWRWRYRDGDKRHHRFWAQVMNWATTEKLAAGNEFARLGTTQDVYEPGETIQVRARLTDLANAPFTTEGASIDVIHNNAVIARKKLAPAPGVPGMYAAEIEPQSAEGVYRIALSVDDDSAPEVAAAANEVATEFVVAPVQSLEKIELSADRAALDQLAEATGGVVVAPRDAASLLEHLGPASQPVVEEDRYPLWHSWPLLAMITCLLTSEWILRKKTGLP